MALNDPYADFDNPLLGLLAIPLGLLAWWGLYAFLKNSWSKTVKKNTNQDILDDSLLLDD